ncbi:thioesterase II family protein [Streptomyces odontomachi]|uniref:thioesterase II family protein n=1 Tax=Streptomyces odontomachi TaxID=2944940 RepID=UPI00210887D5|nr:alpha/beta fold hydrolase [Streptomyces sp. ODS25]
MISTHSREEDRWIRCFHTRPESDVTLLCFPHAGGSASYFFPYSQALAPHVELAAVQYPGRQDRRLEPLIDNIADIADIVHEILTGTLAQGDGRRYAFFGHSMGAIVAFEVAQRMKRTTGTAPVHLFASGRRAPSRHRDGDVHKRDDAGLITELRTVGATDPRFLGDPELLAAILPVTRNDYRAIETYTWTTDETLDCPITAFVGDNDPQTTTDEAKSWAAHTTGEFDMRVFPGGHFYLDAHRAELADTISGVLTQAPRTTTFKGSAA